MNDLRNAPSENIIKLRELVNLLDTNSLESENIDSNQDLLDKSNYIYIIRKTIDAELEHVNDLPSLRHRLKCYESTINKIRKLINTV